MLSLLHLEGGAYTLMETELQSLGLRGLPEDPSPLSTNGSHGNSNAIVPQHPRERPPAAPASCLLAPDKDSTVQNEWHLRLLIGLCSPLSYRLCNLTVALD